MTLHCTYGFIFTLTSLAFLCTAQVQVGNTILPATELDSYGRRVSISEDGSIVAVGCARSTSPDYHAGYVRVYKWEEGEWNQVGEDIKGEKKGDMFGYALALSADGTRLLIGAHRTKFVYVYSFNGTEWVRIGMDIEVGLGGIGLGAVGTHDVAMSADGKVIAAGMADHPQLLIQNGVVRAYRLIDSVWSQIGNDILGEAEMDQSGWSVALSDAGDVVAIGAMSNDGGGNRSGHVRVFRLQGDTWMQIGQDLDGKAEDFHMGHSVALSSTGHRVAFGGAFFYPHEGRSTYVEVYELNAEKWVQVGGDIEGTPDEQFGAHVSLSGDGRRVAISSPPNANCPLRIYEMQGDSWQQVGKAIRANREFDYTGNDIALSRDGLQIVTASNNSGGFVQVFDISAITFEDAVDDICIYEEEEKEEEQEEEEEEASGIIIYPNPTSGIINVTGVSLITLSGSANFIIYDLLGRPIENLTFTGSTIDLTMLPSGVYFLELEDDVTRIVKVTL